MTLNLRKTLLTAFASALIIGSGVTAADAGPCDYCLAGLANPFTAPITTFNCKLLCCVKHQDDPSCKGIKGSWGPRGPKPPPFRD